MRGRKTSPRLRTRFSRSAKNCFGSSPSERALFVAEVDVLALHRRPLEQHGGMDGLRDSGAFKSALHQPEATWYYQPCDLFDIAAAYAFHLAQNQPFIDGNKRVAVTVALAFLELNGVATSPCPDAILYDAMIALAEKRLDKPGLAAVFRAHLS
jgi:death on curing protein